MFGFFPLHFPRGISPGESDREAQGSVSCTTWGFWYLKIKKKKKKLQKQNSIYNTSYNFILRINLGFSQNYYVPNIGHQNI